MVIRKGWILSAALLAALLFLSATPATAGVVYTDETAFDNAVAGLGLAPSFSEDFEGVAAGPVVDPYGIGGGRAEVVGSANSEIIGCLPSGSAWLQPDGSPGNATIRGFGNSALGLRALSFNFGNEVVQTVSVDTTAGIDTSTPFGAPSDPTANFVGWIATGTETVSRARFDHPAGITLDNIDGFVAHAPEPGTFLLFGFGATGLYFAHRRRKGRKTA